MVHKLNALKVKRLTKPGRHADGAGLYLNVEKSGAKSWLLRVTVKGRARTIGLGSIRIVSLSEARDEAARLRKVAKSGGDPLAERDASDDESEIPTFETAARRVHDEQKANWKSAKHRAQWLSTLETYAFPVIGHLRVDEITSSQVMTILQPIWLSKAETARRVRQRLRAVFDWTIAMNLRETMNPVDAVRMVLPKRRDRKQHYPALPYAELPAFLAELREADVNLAVKVAFEFLIATATRTSETLGATWEEVDFESALWTVPGERMKSRIEHRVPLTKHTLELLDQARDLGGNKTWIFPGRSWTRPLYHSAFGVALKRMGWSGITPHGMRSSFRDWTAERTSAPRNVCEAALAHQVGDKTEAAYFRSDLLDRRRLLMNEWSRFLAGGEGKVVNLRA